jgi:succinate dehydrogenase/fumarate reductase cytochrome b subunit
LWTTGLLTNLVASFILHRVSGTILLIFAQSGILTAAILQSLQQQSMPYWAMTFPSLPLMIIGAEFSYLVCSLFVLESVQKTHLSIAAGVFTSLMSLGSAIGAAASSSIRQHVSGQEKKIEGFHAAFWFGVGMAGVAVLLSLTLRVDKRGTREERIRKEREEFQGERVVDAQSQSVVTS